MQMRIPFGLRAIYNVIHSDTNFSIVCYLGWRELKTITITPKSTKIKEPENCFAVIFFVGFFFVSFHDRR